MSTRRPTKRQSFQKIKELGVPIDTVIDVGMLSDTAELRTEFADKRQILIEPIVEWNDKIRARYTETGVNFELINVAAADRDGEMQMQLASVRTGQPITHARLTETPAGGNLRKVPVRKLDTLIAERKLTGPFLLKLDVDGAELQILDGAAQVLPRCNVVVIESNIQNFVERANYLVSRGFTLFDLVDICYYDGRLRQIDQVYLNTKMMNERNLDMYKQGFDMNKWVPFF